jgi:hypothetical protein
MGKQNETGYNEKALHFSKILSTRVTNGLILFSSPHLKTVKLFFFFPSLILLTPKLGQF